MRKETSGVIYDERNDKGTYDSKFDNPINSMSDETRAKCGLEQ
jgi:hypothetical protein